MNRYAVIFLVAMTLSTPGMHAADVSVEQNSEPPITDQMALAFVLQAAASPPVQAELKLTDDQFDTMAKIRASLSHSAGDAAEHHKAIEEATKTIRAVLSAKQLERLMQIHLQLFEVQALLRPDVIAVLKISDNQQKQLRAIDAKRSQKRQGLRDDKSLSQEESQAKGRQLLKETMAEATAVLTQEQQEELEKMRGPAFDFYRRLPPSPAYEGKADYLNPKSN
jgi:hypothetical protein